MSCEYNFTVEWYLTLSKACWNCPFNLTDCFRPQCVSGDGHRRPVITVNRQIPGPAIEVRSLLEIVALRVCVCLSVCVCV